MEVKKALQIFNSKYPDKEAVGYWQDSEQIIFNIKPQYGKGWNEVCQFIVFPDGRVQGTNPARSHLITIQPMKQL